MKLQITVIAVLCFSQLAIAQLGSVVANGNVITNSIRSPIYLQEVFRNPIKPHSYAEINGSPFLQDNWLMSTIELTDDRVFDSIYVKLNAYENKVHFMDDNGDEMQTSVRVKQITITDMTSSWQGAIFRTGYGGNERQFYQVLQDGKTMQLLKKIFVTVWSTKAVGEMDKKTFQLEQEIVFAISNEIFKQNKSCNILAEVIEKNEDKVREFVSSNALKCNKEEDMKKLVIFYNTL